MAASAEGGEGLGRQIERRSIDYVPEDERHGKVWHQGPFWFLGHWGEGYATEAVSRLLNHAFRVLGHHRVCAVVDRENAPSAAVLERIGLRREGAFVENAWFKGRWSSEYLYAALRREWLAKGDGPG